MFKEQHLVRAIRWGLYLVLLTPLVFFRKAMYPFLAPKVLVFQALIEIILALWLLLIILYPKYRPKFTLLSSTVLLLLLFLTLSSLRGLDLHRSLWSVQERSLGLFALFHFAAFFFVLSGMWSAINWKRYFTVSLAASSLVALATVVASAGLIDSVQIFFTTDQARPGTFFGNPAFSAIYLLFHVFLGGWLAYEARGRKAIARSYLALVLINLIGVVLTQTRSAALGLAGGVAVLGFCFLFSRANPHVKKILYLGALGCVAFAALFFFTRGAPVWQNVPALGRFSYLSLSSPEIQPRLIAWKIALHSFAERPLLGFGLENFKYPFDRYYEPRLLRESFVETFFEKPHNVFLEYLVVGGIAGLALYLAFFGIFFRTLVRGASAFLPFGAAAVAAYLINGFFFFDTFGSYLMWFAVAAFVNGAAERAGETEETAARSRPVIAWLLLAGLLLGAAVPIYFVNYRSLYANNFQYWGVNYILNGERYVQSGIEAYEKALAIPHPWIDYVRRDFGTTMYQIYSQGLELPNPSAIAHRALSELVAAVNRHPDDFFLRLKFAEASTIFYVFDPRYLRLGEEQVAQAFRLSKNRQQNYYSLAKIQLIKGDKKEALETMQKAVALDPASGDPHLYYGLLAFSVGDAKLGLHEVLRAEELGRTPRNVDEALILAPHYVEAGEYGRAIPLYRAVLERQPGDHDSRLKLGILYVLTGSTELAKGEIGRVLEALPDFKQSPGYELAKPFIDAVGL